MISITVYKNGFLVCALLVLNITILFSLLVLLLVPYFFKTVTAIIGMFMAMTVLFEPQI